MSEASTHDSEPLRLSDSPKGDRLAHAIIVPLLVAFAAIVLLFYVFFSARQIDGPSMMPGLRNGDRVLITHGDKNLYHGDVIVTSVDESGKPTELVKRVIGLPGDTVEIRDDVAFINGVQEPARGQVVIPDYAVSRGPIKIASGEMYVMGDNRAVSEDSRYLGPVPTSGLKGKVVAIFAPFFRVRLVH